MNTNVSACRYGLQVKDQAQAPTCLKYVLWLVMPTPLTIYDGSYLYLAQRLLIWYR